MQRWVSKFRVSDLRAIKMFPWKVNEIKFETHGFELYCIVFPVSFPLPVSRLTEERRLFLFSLLELNIC